MSLPRYERYKDSGVEWLGEVPDHWEVQKIKYISVCLGGGTPSRENLDYWNGNIPWVSPKDMKVERIQNSEESITQEGLINSSSNLINSGHVLLVVRSGILKHTIPVAINDVDVTLNQDMKALRMSGGCKPDFLLRWIQGLNSLLLLAWSKQGATVESIEHEYLSNTLIPLPSLNEQEEVLDYIAKETLQIDALLTEAQKTILLLHERRTALISAAVTGKIDVRGLVEHPDHEVNS
jgi:type I restriction enzyme S subunit